MRVAFRIGLRALRAVAARFDYAVVPRKSTLDFYLHEYASYDEYRRVQVFHNKRKIDKVWADEAALRRVADLVLADRPADQGVAGLCHGTRNGFEQKFLNSLCGRIRAIGTDISDTATSYPDSVQWDFHDARAEWVGAFDFVYTNSLDQSWQPKRALEVWLNQIRRDGALIVEHTDAHGPLGASEMDPFGVRPVAMPYVLTMWFGDQITITHSKARKGNMNEVAWLFVMRKRVDEVRARD